MANVKNVVVNCLKILKEQAVLWDTICGKSDTYLSTITNIGQQVTCCRCAKLQHTPFNETSFPDLKQKLLSKLFVDCNTALVVLRTKLSELQVCCDKINTASRRAVNTLQSNAKEPDLYMWSATEPAISDVTLWICNASAVAKQQLAEKRTLLDAVEFDEDGQLDIDSIVNIEKCWKGHNELTSSFNDIFDMCSFMKLE